MQQTDGTNTLNFSYSPDGRPLAVNFDGTNYYYLYNLQGDVIGLYDTSGTVVVQYKYDSWGCLLSITGSKASTLGVLNPFRYRGYVYDEETGFYWLRSRYYDPETGRFLNVDGYVSTGTGLSGYNMFAYCNNNPVCYYDSQGNRSAPSTSVQNETSYDRAMSCKWQNKVTLEKYNPEPIGRYSSGNIYLVEDESELYTTFSGDIVIIDKRNSKKYPEVQIINSYLITDKKDQLDVLNVLSNYENANPSNWMRNEDITNMQVEWHDHNLLAWILTYTPLTSLFERARSVNFDNNDAEWSAIKWVLNQLN